MMDVLCSIGITVCNGKVEARVTGLFVKVIGKLELRSKFHGPFARREWSRKTDQDVVALAED